MAAPAVPPLNLSSPARSPRRPSSPAKKPQNPLDRLAALDDKPLKTTLKHAALEYAPPKNLTIREMRITHKAGATLVWNTGRRLNKLISYVNSLHAEAVAIYEDTDNNMDNNPSISECGSDEPAARSVIGGLRELRDISELTFQAMQKQRSDLRDLEGRLAKC